MEIKVKKWGNSLAVRIPKSYAKEINIDDGSIINIFRDKDKIILQPKEKKEKLNKLLTQINKNNIHEEVETGIGVGNEIW